MPELVEVMFRHPTPTTTPKLQLDLLEKSFLSKFEVVGGGGLAPDPPTTPKLQLDFLDLESFLVKVWGSGGWGGGLAPDLTPHHYHP